MRVSLLITKDRVKYIVEQFGADRITVVKKEEPVDQIFDTVDEVIFEMNYTIDFLTMFHAGVECGMALNEKNKPVVV